MESLVLRTFVKTRTRTKTKIDCGCGDAHGFHNSFHCCSFLVNLVLQEINSLNLVLFRQEHLKWIFCWNWLIVNKRLYYYIIIWHFAYYIKQTSMRGGKKFYIYLSLPSCNTTLTVTHSLRPCHAHCTHMCACACAYTAFQSPKADLIPECEITVCQAKSGHAASSRAGVLQFSLSLLGKIFKMGQMLLVMSFIESCTYEPAHKNTIWVEKHLSDKSIIALHYIKSATNSK